MSGEQCERRREISNSNALNSGLLRAMLTSEYTPTELPLTISSVARITKYGLEQCIDFLLLCKGETVAIPKRSIDIDFHDFWKNALADERGGVLSAFINRVHDQSIKHDKLYEVIRAANYMDINALVHLACSKLACIIRSQAL